MNGEVHHVRSFHQDGNRHYSRSDYRLESSSKNIFKTAAAIIFLLPGLCFGSIFKGLSYLSQSTREKHRLVKQHFTPENKFIGSHQNPLDENQIFEALQVLHKDPLHQKINALVIYGKDVQMNNDPGIGRLNPKKLILVGAQIVHQPSPFDRLDDKLSRYRKWCSKVLRLPGGTFVTQKPVRNIVEALADQLPRRPGSFARYHRVYVVTSQ
jgi:hypothetical protein